MFDGIGDFFSGAWDSASSWTSDNLGSLSLGSAWEGIKNWASDNISSDTVGNIVGGVFNLATNALANSLNMRNSRKMAQYNAQISRELAAYGFDLQKKGLEVAKGLRDQSVQETPGLMKAGLLAAGYNPILAVNSSAGQPFSQSVNPTVGGADSSAPRVDLSKVDLPAIDQTKAQTDFIKRRTLSEGWQIRTLSRSEAKGLGANLLGKLGFNFNDHSQTTFLVAYNPITGELRNLGDTESGLGSTGPASSADDVPDGEVIVSEPYHVRTTQAFPKGRKHN